MEPLNQLIESIRKAQVILFLGSGFSLKAGAPSGSGLVKAIKSNMTNEELQDEWGETRDCEKGESSLAKVSQVYERLRDSRGALLNIVENAMSFERKDMTDHKALTQIPHFQTIITTNYDTLLEDTYGDDCHVIRTASDCINKPSDKVQIYKIHGDFLAKENIVLTEEDYTRFFDKDRGNSMWAAVKDELLSHDVLFIGYSLDDANLFHIIKDINSETTGTPHNYYLVAPSLTTSSRKKIEKEGVSYIDGRAGDILPKIIEVLDKKVDGDFKHRRISTDLYNKYCRLHKFIPTTKPSSDGKTNSVSEYELIEGKVDVQFTVPKETAIALRDFDFDKLSSDLHIKRNSIGVPYYSLDKEMMRDFEMSINNMVTMDQEEIKKLVVLPRTHKKTSFIRIPSIGFNEKVEYTLYGVTGGCHAILPTEIFNIDMTIKGTMDESQISINFKEKYKNNSEAIKWIDFIIAFCSGEVVHSTDVLTTFAVKKNEEFVNTLRNMKQYYKNLNDIECKYNTTFDEYENYSPDRYRMSLFLLAICNEGYIDVSSKFNKAPICINTTKTPKQLQEMSVKTGDHFALKYSQEVLSPYSLCGHDFNFKNRITFIYDALVTDVSSVDKSLTQITYNSVGVVYQMYTDRDTDTIIDVERFNVIPIVSGDSIKKEK